MADVKLLFTSHSASNYNNDKWSVTMLRNLIGNYKKRRRDEVKNPAPVSVTDDQRGQSSYPAADSNTSSILFHCREGSVTHYYHFFFGALVPLIEYHLANPSKVLRILTDVGPFKLILCELPLTISELHGPNLTLQGHFHDDKSLHQVRQMGQISLKAYDCFNNDFFGSPHHFPRPPHETIRAINNFFHESVPFYIRDLPTYDVLLIQRAKDVYYKSGGCADRGHIFQTSGSERRSITNHEDLIAAIRAECSEAGQTFCNISLESTSIYYQYHMFSNANVVIAQHGAALSNIFFMARNGSSGVAMSTASSRTDNQSPVQAPTVIEISPPWSRQFEHFKNLATYCEVNYSSVTQQQDHSEVNVSDVVELVRGSLSGSTTLPTPQSQLPSWVGS